VYTPLSGILWLPVSMVIEREKLLAGLGASSSHELVARAVGHLTANVSFRTGHLCKFILYALHATLSLPCKHLHHSNHSWLAFADSDPKCSQVNYTYSTE